MSSPGPEKGCPIPGPHRRLEQGHRYWHEATEHYGEPELFEGDLTSLLQALRSVTFLLQSDKSKVPGFDAWYPAWQQKMKGDPLMVWLNSARVQVVHTRDLETTSTAQLRLLSSWTEHSSVTLPAPPTMDSAALAAVFGPVVAKGIPESARKAAVLAVERRWIVDDLPGYEILDAIARCHGALVRLMDEAHRMCGCSMAGDDELLADEIEYAIGPEARLPCMSVGRDLRTTRISLVDGSELTHHSRRTRIHADDPEVAAAAARYGMKEQAWIAQDPMDIARTIHEQARRVFLTDGHHESFLFLLKDQEAVGMMGLRAESEAERTALWHHVVDEGQDLGADAAIVVGEAWAAPVAREDPIRDVATMRGRKEVLLTQVVTKGGGIRSFQSDIIRKGNQTKLGGTSIDDTFTVSRLSLFQQAWMDDSGTQS